MTGIGNLGSTPSLKRRVYDTLQRMIVHCELAPGQKLTEEELARSMDISRAPIREALNMLDRDGFVEISPRKGAVVTEVSDEEAREIWRCRLVLEPYAAREATPNIPQAELEKLLARVEYLEQQPYRFEDMITSDLELHDMYHVYAGNKRLKGILDNLQAYATRVRWLHESHDIGRAMPSVAIVEHKAILEAFLARDSEAAARAVQVHMRKGGLRLLGSLD